MQFILRILSFSSLVLLTILSMLIEDSAPLRIANFYISDWLFGDLVYRIFTIWSLYVAFLILFGKINKFTKISCILILAFALIDVFAMPSDRAHYYTLFVHLKHEALSYVAIGLFSISTLLLVKAPYSKILKNWLSTFLVLPAIALSFLNLVYASDLGDLSDGKTISRSTVAELTTNDDWLKEEQILIPFFSTTCGFCKLAAIKMGITHRNGRLPSTMILFPGNKEDAEQFIKDAKIEGVPYQLVDKSQFIKVAGNRLPSIFYLDGENSLHWTGEKFNQFAFKTIAPK